MNDEFEINIETENNIEVSPAKVNPKNPALDNRAVHVKGERTSNIRLGKNKKKLILLNDEYVLSEEIVAKTMEYIAELEKKEKVTIIVKKLIKNFRNKILKI